ncbi:MAG: membrane protein insertion efficiency factor YidD [Brevinemataceae bacterium]
MEKGYLFHSFQRIKTKKEFNTLFEKGFRIYGNFFVCRIIFHNKKIPYSKLGIVVSKKFGNAVFRNTIKRMVREHFRKVSIPLDISVLISQSKLSQNKKSYSLELKRMFELLSDQLFLKQCMVSSNISLQHAQSSNTLFWGTKQLCNLLVFYKLYISRSLPSACRFCPTCSLYALEAFRVFGFWKGLLLSTKRIISCNPFGSKGIDYVPIKKERKPIVKEPSK